jgi:hypothetical protein
MPVRQHNETDPEYEKRFRDWKIRYNNLFSTTQGKLVLADILEELGLFHNITNEEERVKNNFAKRLLYLCDAKHSFELKRKE